MVVGLGALFAVGMSVTSWLLSTYMNEIQDSEMFMTARHSVKTGLTASAVVSSWTIAATLLTSTTYGYSYGVSGPFWVCCATDTLDGELTVEPVRGRCLRSDPPFLGRCYRAQTSSTQCSDFPPSRKGPLRYHSTRGILVVLHAVPGHTDRQSPGGRVGGLHGHDRSERRCSVLSAADWCRHLHVGWRHQGNLHHRLGSCRHIFERLGLIRDRHTRSSYTSS